MSGRSRTFGTGQRSGKLSEADAAQLRELLEQFPEPPSRSPPMPDAKSVTDVSLSHPAPAVSPSANSVSPTLAPEPVPSATGPNIPTSIAREQDSSPMHQATKIDGIFGTLDAPLTKTNDYFIQLLIRSFLRFCFPDCAERRQVL